MKIFISVIAIFLSATMPNALATTETASDLVPPPIIQKIIVDLQNQKTDSVQRLDGAKGQCHFKFGNSVTNKNSNKHSNITDLTCPIPGSSKDPDEF
jgi:hypothetical protein